jgi:5,10-methylenetetrahydromethanopterin reductase
MRIGTLLDTSGNVTVGDIQEELRAAAAHGLDSAWSNQTPGGWDPLTVLAPAGDGPGELGTAVVPTYPRHPAVMATEALTVQAMSGRRLALGVGPSHEHVMTGWYGIPYTSPARHTREYLEVLRPLLRGEHVKYSGDFFTIDTQLAIRGPAPSVLIAALGPRMLQVARDLADGTIAVWARPETVADYLVPRLADDARIVLTLMVAVTNDPDGARERIARDLAIVTELPAYRAMFDRGGLSGPADALVAGDESTVLRELERFRDAGVTDLVVSARGSKQERARVLDVVAQGFAD